MWGLGVRVRALGLGGVWGLGAGVRAWELGLGVGVRGWGLGLGVGVGDQEVGPWVCACLRWGPLVSWRQAVGGGWGMGTWA